MASPLQPPILPPPYSALFPPPLLSTPNLSASGSSPSGSTRKRKRDNSVVSNTSRFSEATRNKLSRLYGKTCWHCGAAAAMHNCHIIAQKDRSVRSTMALSSPYANLRCCSLNFTENEVLLRSIASRIWTTLSDFAPHATPSSTTYNALDLSSILATYASLSTSRLKTTSGE